MKTKILTIEGLIGKTIQSVRDFGYREVLFIFTDETFAMFESTSSGDDVGNPEIESIDWDIGAHNFEEYLAAGLITQDEAAPHIADRREREAGYQRAAEIRERELYDALKVKFGEQL